MNDSAMEVLKSIHKGTAFAADATLDYLFKLHSMLITQHLMLREIMLKLGMTPQEIDALTLEMAKTAQTAAGQVAKDVVERAGKPPKS
jgi:hypothetical protein